MTTYQANAPQAITRQERRAKLKAEMALVEKRGIAANADAEPWWWAVAAETRFLIDILSGGKRERASAAAKHAHEFYDRSVKSNTPDGPVECAKGCSLCCSLYVTATAPEVFLVANFLRHEYPQMLPQIMDKVRNADRDTRYMDHTQRLKTNLPCPLLSEGACSVYAARPSACRSLVSSSLLACQRGFGGENVEIPRPTMWWKLRSAHLFALEAAMVDGNLPSHHYNFNHALRIALDDPQAEERWLSGVDVFEHVRRDTREEDSATESREERLVNLITAAKAQDFSAT